MERGLVFSFALATALVLTAIEPLLLTPEEVGDALGVRRTTVYEMLRRGDIPSLKLGRLRRVARADLEDFVASQTRTVAPGSPIESEPTE